MMLCWPFGVSRACLAVYRFRLFGVWLVPPDDYDHWAPEPQAGDDGEDAASSGLKSEDWQWGSEAEPRFKVARKSGVVPHSPAAG